MRNRKNQPSPLFRNALNLSLILGLCSLNSTIVSAQNSRSTPGANLGSGDTQAFNSAQLGDYVELDASIKNEMYGTIDFPNAELKDIIMSISKLAKKNFILDRKIENRRITILSPEPVTKQEAYNAFLSALYMNDLTIVAEGKFLKVIDTKAALQSNVRVFMGEYAPNTAEVITVLYPLKNLNADDIQRYLTDLVPRTGRIAAYPNTNTLVMTDTGFNIRRIIEIIKTIDIPGHEDQLENIPIRYASAKDIAQLIDEILTAQSGGTSSRRSSRNQEVKKTRGGGVITKIVPDERTNSLVVLANGRGIEELRNLVDALDSPNAAGGGNIHLYYAKNAVAEELATTINSLISNSSSNNNTRNSNSRTSTLPRNLRRTTVDRSDDDSGSGLKFDGNLRVTADKATNSLVVVSSASDFAALKKILEKLDIPRKQVFVEATILEMRNSDGHELDFGVNFAAEGQLSVGGFQSSDRNISSFIQDPTSLTGLLAGFQAGSEYTVGGVRVRSVQGLIQALETNNQANVLHRPQILTSDNQQAEVKVTDTLATIVQSVTGSGEGAVRSENVERINVVTSLKITPQLRENSDLVKMQVEQTVDNASRAQSPGAGNQYDTTNRTTKTSVVVRDGQTVAIGGLQRTSTTDQRSRIPILGDLPIIGKLFGDTEFEEVKSTLMILLKPTIINSNEDLLSVTRQSLAKRKEVGSKLTDPEDRFAPIVEELIKETDAAISKSRSQQSWAPPAPGEDAMSVNTFKEELQQAAQQDGATATIDPRSASNGLRSNSETGAGYISPEALQGDSLQIEGDENQFVAPPLYDEVEQETTTPLEDNEA